MCSWGRLLVKSVTVVGSKNSSTSPIILSNTNNKSTTITVLKAWLNSNTASIGRINRNQYLRQYPTLFVNPEGSTFTIRYHEPRKIIKLPLDLSKYTEEERKILLEKRRPKTRVKFEEDVEDISFDSGKYLKLVKK